MANINGYECAHIEVEAQPFEQVTNDGVKQRVRSNGNTYFAIKEGLLVKSEVNTYVEVEAENAKFSSDIALTVELERVERETAATGEEGFIIGT